MEWQVVQSLISTRPQVRTRLSNPTRYHVIQSQRRQVKAYLGSDEIARGDDNDGDGHLKVPDGVVHAHSAPTGKDDSCLRFKPDQQILNVCS